jgi:hypothetical protein
VADWRLELARTAKLAGASWHLGQMSKNAETLASVGSGILMSNFPTRPTNNTTHPRPCTSCMWCIKHMHQLQSKNEPPDNRASHVSPGSSLTGGSAPRAIMLQHSKTQEHGQANGWLSQHRAVPGRTIGTTRFHGLSQMYCMYNVLRAPCSVQRSGTYRPRALFLMDSQAKCASACPAHPWPLLDPTRPALAALGSLVCKITLL